MNIEEAREYCLSLKNVTECFPFDDVSLVFKVEGKMFLLLPDYAIELRDHYNGVEGAWHFNKKYWNTIYLDRDMPDSEIKHWIHHSYREVIAKLPKKIREAYENE